MSKKYNNWDGSPHDPTIKKTSVMDEDINTSSSRDAESNNGRFPPNDNVNNDTNNVSEEIRIIAFHLIWRQINT